MWCVVIYADDADTGRRLRATPVSPRRKMSAAHIHDTYREQGGGGGHKLAAAPPALGQYRRQQ